MIKKIFIILAWLNFTTCLAAEKLVVLLDWYPNPNQAPLFVAKQQGFFDQQGLDVTLIGPSDPADPPKLIAAGKADIAITYEPKLIEQVDHGLPLVRIGTLIDQPLDCLVALKSSHITSILDLKDKRVGYSNGGVNVTLLKIMLEHQHLSLANTQAINVHYNLTQSLLSGKVDAVTGMMRNFELTQLELAGHPAIAFYPEDNGMPSYSELVFVANKNKINDTRLVKFLAALKQSVTYLKQHPEETWQQFATSHPELNDELDHRAWGKTIAYFAKDPASFDAKKWTNFIEFMHQNGLISQVQPVSAYTVKLVKE